jgi:Ca2+-binding RTX toxin-like protein
MAKFEPKQGDWKQTVYGTAQGDVLVGDSSDDTIWAQGGDDSLDGVHGTDVLDGGDGADTLSGGTGTDYLTGGLGGDRFDLGRHGGWDVIQDYHPEQGDQIWVQTGGAFRYSTQVIDGDTYVDFHNGNGLVIVGFTPSNTPGSDFLFFY